MKNVLQEIFDAITMLFSPLIEGFFDHAEALSARREIRKSRRRVQTTLDAAASQDAGALGTRRTESFGW